MGHSIIRICLSATLPFDDVGCSSKTLVSSFPAAWKGHKKSAVANTPIHYSLITTFVELSGTLIVQEYNICVFF